MSLTESIVDEAALEWFGELGYAIRHPVMQNPTLVVLTDRNDLDDQLFGQFQRCHELLGQMPVQAASREKLRELLAVAGGGVVFTTLQKFFPRRARRCRPRATGGTSSSSPTRRTGVNTT